MKSKSISYRAARAGGKLAAASVILHHRDSTVAPGADNAGSLTPPLSTRVSPSVAAAGPIWKYGAPSLLVCRPPYPLDLWVRPSTRSRFSRSGEIAWAIFGAAGRRVRVLPGAPLPIAPGTPLTGPPSLLSSLQRADTGPVRVITKPLQDKAFRTWHHALDGHRGPSPSSRGPVRYSG